MNDTTYAGARITIEHLTLDGNSAANTGTVPLVLRTWDSLIQDVEIRYAPGDAIQVSNPSQNGTMLTTTNTAVNSTIKDFFITNSGGSGIHVVDPGDSMTDWIVEDGWIANSGASGIAMDNAAGWQIRNVHIYGVQEDAIYANLCYGTGIHDNYIEDFGNAGATGATYHGIFCAAQQDASSVISGNKVHMFNSLPSAGAFHYVEVDGNSDLPKSPNQPPLVSVTGNTVRGQGNDRETALYYGIGDVRAMTIVSTGNAVENVKLARYADPGVTVTAGY